MGWRFRGSGAKGSAGRRAEAAGARPATPAQARMLAAMARKAFEVQRGLGLADGDFDAWRRAELAAATGAGSFLALDQRGVDAAKARFLALAGGPSAGAEDDAEAGDRRRAEWALGNVLSECDRKGVFGPAGSAEAYAESIARDQNGGRGIAGLDAAGLNRLAFTVRARARAAGARAARRAGKAGTAQERAGARRGGGM